MSFRLIEGEREHLQIVVGRALAGRNTAPARLAVDGLAVDGLAFTSRTPALSQPPHATSVMATGAGAQAAAHSGPAA